MALDWTASQSRDGEGGSHNSPAGASPPLASSTGCFLNGSHQRGPKLCQTYGHFTGPKYTQTHLMKSLSNTRDQLFQTHCEREVTSSRLCLDSVLSVNSLT